MLRNSIWLKNIEEEQQIDGFKIKINVTAGQDFKMTFQNIASAVFVSWGDGSAPQNVSANGQASKTYSSGGEKIVTISGRFGVRFDNEADDAVNAEKVTDVLSWGNGDGVKFTNCEGMFYFCSNLRATLSATDTPDLSLCTDMSSMFAVCSLFNTNINNWNVSTIQNMSGLFAGSAFDQPLNNWLVDNVTDMSQMFQNTPFNQLIGNWNTGKVEDMESMFLGSSFNQSLNSWNVGNVTNMSGMFDNAEQFNQPLNSWNVGNVTAMASMFTNAIAFNQPLDQWNVGNVTDMFGMFRDARAFNRDLSMWCVTKITTKPGDFDLRANAWQGGPATRPCWGNCPADFSNGFKFVVNNVGGSFKMKFQNLEGIARINWGDPCGFQTVGANGTVTHNYSGAGPYTITISGTFGVRLDNEADDAVNAEKVTDVLSWGRAAGVKFTNCVGMFYFCSNLRATLSATDTPDLSLCTNMSAMFALCSRFNTNINNWNVSTIQNMSNLFAGSAFDQSLNNWLVDNVTDMSYMFYTTAFNQPIGNWNTGKVENMDTMFGYNSVFNQSLNSWNVGNVTNTNFMFDNAEQFNQPLDQWNVGNVTDMTGMFRAAPAFNRDLSMWCVTKIPTKPGEFDDAATAWTLPNSRPQWGTCPPPPLPPLQGFKFVVDELDKIFYSELYNEDAPTSTFEIRFQNMTNGAEAIIDWGDGSARETVTTNNFIARHTYGGNGPYTITIAGTFGVSFSVNNNAGKVREVLTWGRAAGVKFTTCSSMFSGCFNLSATTASDIPDLSICTSLSAMFGRCINFNGSVTGWNTSNVTSMSFMFQECAVFNQPVNFDLSSIESLNNNNRGVASMFSFCTLFNSPVVFTNTSNLRTVESLFVRCSNFNQPITFDTTNVEIMAGMFNRALKFNQPLNQLKTGNVVNMSAMFNDASEFNQDLSMWCVSNISSKPLDFDTNTPAWTLPKPVWGTCPP